MKTLAALIFLFPTLSGAHGADTAGPNGGHVSMPGDFHTELTLDDEQGAHIFLLDGNLENPTVKNSKIEMVAKNKKSEVKFSCSVMGGNHFHCVPQKKYPLKGELVVKATRDGVVGKEISYKLPLKKFETEKTEQSNESHHH